MVNAAGARIRSRRSFDDWTLMSTPSFPPGSEQPERRETGDSGGQPSGNPSEQGPGAAGRPAPRYGQYAPGHEGQQPPQYGQPQFGQQPQYGQQPPQYGQQPPQYGQGQYSQPAYPPPYGTTAGFGAPSPQQQRSAVRSASVLLFATAAVELVIAVLATIVALAIPADALRELYDQASGSSSGMSFAQFRQFISGFVWFALACVVVNAAVLVVCGIFLPKGRRWARTTGTIFLCLTIGSVFSGGLFALVTIALAVAAIVALFRSPVTAFLAAQNQFANPYSGPKGPSLGNPYGQ